MSLKRRLQRSAVERTREPRPGRWAAPRLQLRWLIAGLLLTLIPIVAGWLERSLHARRHGNAITVPVGAMPGTGYLRLAAQVGLSDRRQLDLQVVEVDDQRQVMEGYLQGRFPIVPVSTVEALQICELAPQRCPMVVLILEESLGADKVVVRPWVVGLEGLRGRRVAVMPTGRGRFLLGRALSTVGMGLGDVTLVPSPPQSIPRLLHKGDVEGAALPVPWSDHATRLGTSRPVFDSSRIPGEIQLLLAVDPQLLRHQPESLARLLRIWQDAHDWADEHREAAANLLGAAGKLSASGQLRAEEGLRVLSLEQQLELLRPGGTLDQRIAWVDEQLHTMQLLPRDTRLPRVNDRPLKRALALR